MYIYDSHMGGLFSSDEALSWEETYCEQCGDSDTLIGHANNVKEAWKLLEYDTQTFDDSKCEKCKHYEDYDFCDSECEEWTSDYSIYSLYYVMNFLSQNFEKEDVDKNMSEVYLFVKLQDKEKGLRILTGKPYGYDWGEKHILPHVACIDKKFENMLARSLVVFSDSFICQNITKLKEVSVDKRNIVIYECGAVPGEYSNDKASWNVSNTWYGFTDIDDISPLADEEKKVFEIYKKLQKASSDNADITDSLKKKIEKTVVGLTWTEIESLYDDCADTLSHQIYQDKIYWDCVFDDKGVCTSVKFVFHES